jgi:hypothetical protein
MRRASIIHLAGILKQIMPEDMQRERFDEARQKDRATHVQNLFWGCIGVMVLLLGGANETRWHLKWIAWPVTIQCWFHLVVAVIGLGYIICAFGVVPFAIRRLQGTKKAEAYRSVRSVLLRYRTRYAHVFMAGVYYILMVRAGHPHLALACLLMSAGLLVTMLVITRVGPPILARHVS